jgi:O-antigen ligase
MKSTCNARPGSGAIDAANPRGGETPEVTLSSSITTRPRAPRRGGTSADFLLLGSLAVIAIVLGWAVARSDGFGADPGSAVVLTAGGLGCAALIRTGPQTCLAAIGALTITGFLPVIAHSGDVELNVADIFYVGALAWWLVGAVERAGRIVPDKRPRIAFGQAVAIVFLAYAGLTLVTVQSSDSGAVGSAFVSWLRLVQTASLAWLAASLIESKRDIRLILGAIAAAGVVAVADGALSGGSLLTERSGGSLGPNALGLVSGLLLLIAAFGAVTSKAPYRVALGATGLLGLLLTQSVASLVATGFVLALGASLGSRSSAAAPHRATRAVLGVALAGVLVFSVVQFLRPEVSPASESFRNGSAAQRIILGAAGLEIFERNPIVGAGWRQSSSPQVIGDREIAMEVRRRFPDFRPIFYPDVTPGSVHNTYVQILADLGLVGFALLVALIVTVALRVRELLRRLGREHALWPQAWTMSLGLLLVLIWSNDNPLFGGQVDTVVPSLFLGALAAIARMTSASSTSVAEPDGHPPGSGRLSAKGRALTPSTRTRRGGRAESRTLG